jgi:hypothetical protein
MSSRNVGADRLVHFSATKSAIILSEPEFFPESLCLTGNIQQLDQRPSHNPLPRSLRNLTLLKQRVILLHNILDAFQTSVRSEHEFSRSATFRNSSM